MNPEQAFKSIEDMEGELQKTIHHAAFLKTWIKEKKQDYAASIKKQKQDERKKIRDDRAEEKKKIKEAKIAERERKKEEKKRTTWQGVLTHELLLHVVVYCPETGVFHERRKNGTVGDMIGRQSGTFWVIDLFGEEHVAQRLAWFYVHGTWPDGEVEVRDGNWMNFRIDNVLEEKSMEII